MVQVNYNQDRDELEILFKEVDVPEVVTLGSGVLIEFSPDALSAIILPNFFKMVHMPPTDDIEFTCIDNNVLKLKIGEHKINVKIDLLELENQ